MEIKIVEEFPPNIKEIRKALDLAGRTPVFTYGLRIYNPYKCFLPQDLRVHEGTHVEQQNVWSASLWWEKYLSDPKFRLEQELEAYRNQFKFYKTINKGWMKFLQRIASDLSSKMYGNIISYPEALNKILK